MADGKIPNPNNPQNSGRGSLRERAINAMVDKAVLGKNHNDLRQFSEKNITNQRNLDIAAEKAKAKMAQKEYGLQKLEENKSRIDYIEKLSHLNNNYDNDKYIKAKRDEYSNKIEKKEKQYSKFKRNNEQLFDEESKNLEYRVDRSNGGDTKSIAKINKYDKKIDRGGKKARKYSLKRDRLLEQSGNKKYYKVKQDLHNARGNLDSEKGRQISEWEKRRKAGLSFKDKVELGKIQKTELKPFETEVKRTEANFKLSKAESKLKTRNAAPASFKLEKRETYTFNEKTGKIEKGYIKSTEVKPIDYKGSLASRALKGAVITQPAAELKNAFRRNSGDTAGNEAAMKIYDVSEKGIRYAHKLHKESPYKRVAKLQFKADKANAKLHADRQGGNIFQRHSAKKQYMRNAAKSRKVGKRLNPVQKLYGNMKHKVQNAVKTGLKKVVASKAGVILIVGFLIIGIVSFLPMIPAMMFVGGDGTTSFSASVKPSSAYTFDVSAAFEHSLEFLEKKINDDIFFKIGKFDYFIISLTADSDEIDFQEMMDFVQEYLDFFPDKTYSDSIVDGFFNKIYKIDVVETGEKIKENSKKGIDVTIKITKSDVEAYKNSVLK